MKLFQTVAGKLKPKNLIYYEQLDTVLEIIDITSSKPGKHGSAKVLIQCNEFFRLSTKLIVLTFRSSENITKVELEAQSGLCTELLYNSSLEEGLQIYCEQLPEKHYDKQRFIDTNIGNLVKYLSKDVKDVVAIALIVDSNNTENFEFIPVITHLQDPSVMENKTVQYYNTPYGRKILSFKKD